MDIEANIYVAMRPRELLMGVTVHYKISDPDCREMIQFWGRSRRILIIYILPI